MFETKFHIGASKYHVPVELNVDMYLQVQGQ
jgi:hypothetical protein